MHRWAPLLGDRLVPSRRTTDFEAAYFRMMNGDSSGSRVLSYGTAASPVPAPCEKRFPTQEEKRRIPKTADLAVNLPEFPGDYYLNALDWSSGNLIGAVSYQKSYLINASSGNSEGLAHRFPDPSSVKFSEDGSRVAFGTESGLVEIWDVQQRRFLYAKGGGPSRIFSLAWNGHMLTTGFERGWFHIDTRI